ncbi:PASTA domain-containing protein [Lentzea sp. NPDC058450]|uniref:PASTA domain-containing protein n=1 Tax=Lentzea sp. NPDC058450 TaxID=3346505 RepID=UPI0036627123
MPHKISKEFIRTGAWVSWQLWTGPFIGLVALAFAVYSYWKNRTPKRLQHETKVDQRIIATSRYNRWGDLRIQFGEKTLRSPRIVVIRLTNSGKIEARADDFVEPISINVGEGDSIVAAAITGGSGAHHGTIELQPEQVDQQRVVAPRSLLNEGDWLEFHLLIDGSATPVRLDCRVAGFSVTSGKARSRTNSTSRLDMWQASRLPVLVVTAIGLIYMAVTLFGPPGGVPVPDLVGKSAADSVRELSNANLKASDLIIVPGDESSGTVVSQIPKAGKNIRSGDSVTLYISD